MIEHTHPKTKASALQKGPHEKPSKKRQYGRRAQPQVLVLMFGLHFGGREI